MASPYLPFALGAVAGAALALAAPTISRNYRPALKEAIKAALMLAREAQVKAVEFVEMLEDAYAEAQLEMRAAAATPAAAAPSPARRRTAAPKAKQAPARKGARRVTQRAATGAAANA